VAADCLALLRAERFDEALALLEADTSPEDPEESEIVRAALLTNKGELVRARASCARVLAIRASNAEAHYLLGLCDELEQRTEAAEANYVRASALDDDFAIPRLRLGVLSRKRGLRTDARRLLGAALRLFPHQTERRVLIFGGGFRAEALTRLCKVELHACNKSP
jgi:chemotaxis protein methyltransferase CheR